MSLLKNKNEIEIFLYVFLKNKDVLCRCLFHWTVTEALYIIIDLEDITTHKPVSNYILAL